MSGKWKPSTQGRAGTSPGAFDKESCSARGPYPCSGEEGELWLSQFEALPVLLYVKIALNFLGSHPQHMEVPRLGVQSKL